MKSRKIYLPVIVAAALATSAMSSPTANAAGSWHGPYDSYPACAFASGQDNPLMFINLKVPCERHNDGKWWYQTRWF